MANCVFSFVFPQLLGEFMDVLQGFFSGLLGQPSSFFSSLTLAGLSLASFAGLHGSTHKEKHTCVAVKILARFNFVAFLTVSKRRTAIISARLA
jgi:hypothetical protein